MNNNRSHRAHSPNEVDDKLMSGRFLAAVMILILLIVAYGTWPKPYDFLLNLAADLDLDQLQLQDQQRKEYQRKEHQRKEHQRKEKQRQGDAVEKPTVAVGRAVITVLPTEIERSTKPKPAESSNTMDVRSVLEEIRPDGVYIEEVMVRDNRINIQGYADNNQAVARFLRVINEKVGEPDLNLVKQEQRNQQTVSKFSITIKLTFE